jgi:hypothetical protein
MDDKAQIHAQVSPMKRLTRMFIFSNQVQQSTINNLNSAQNQRRERNNFQPIATDLFKMNGCLELLPGKK